MSESSANSRPMKSPSSTSILQSLASAGVDIKSAFNLAGVERSIESQIDLGTNNNFRILEALVQSMAPNQSSGPLPAQWPPPIRQIAARTSMSQWPQNLRPSDHLSLLRPIPRPRPVPRPAVPSMKRSPELGHIHSQAPKSTFVPLVPPAPPVPLLLAPGGLPSALLQAAPFLGDPSSWPFAVVQRPENGEPCFALVLASLKPTTTSGDPKSKSDVSNSATSSGWSYKSPPRIVGPPRSNCWWNGIFEQPPPASGHKRQKTGHWKNERLLSPLRSLLNDSAVLGDLDIPLPADVERLSRRRAERRPTKRLRPNLSTSPTTTTNGNLLAKPKWGGEFEFTSLLSQKNNLNVNDHDRVASDPTPPPVDLPEKKSRGRPPKIEPDKRETKVEDEKRSDSPVTEGRPPSPTSLPTVTDDTTIARTSGWTVENFYSVARRRELVSLGLGHKAATAVINDEWAILQSNLDKMEIFTQSVIKFLASANLPPLPSQSDVPRDLRKFRQLASSRIDSPWDGAVTEALQGALDAEEENGTFSPAVSPTANNSTVAPALENFREDGPTTRRRSQRLNKDVAASAVKSHGVRPTSSDDDGGPVAQKCSTSPSRGSGESSNGRRSSPRSAGQCPKFVLGGIDRRLVSSTKEEQFVVDGNPVRVEFWDFRNRRNNRAWDDLNEKRLSSAQWKSVIHPGSLVQLAWNPGECSTVGWWDATVVDCCGDFVRLELSAHGASQEISTLRSSFVPPNVPIFEVSPGLWRIRPAKLPTSQVAEVAARLSRGSIVVVQLESASEMRDAQICDVWYSPSRPLTVGLRPLGHGTSIVSVVADRIKYILPFDLQMQTESGPGWLIPVCIPGKFSTDNEKSSKIDSNIISLDRSIAVVPASVNIFSCPPLIARLWRLGFPVFTPTTTDRQLSVDFSRPDRSHYAPLIADIQRPRPSFNFRPRFPPSWQAFPSSDQLLVPPPPPPPPPRSTTTISMHTAGIPSRLMSIPPKGPNSMIHGLHLQLPPGNHFHEGQPIGMHVVSRPPPPGTSPLVFLRRSEPQPAKRLATGEP